MTQETPGPAGADRSATPPILDVHSHAAVDFGDGMDANTNLPIGMIPPWSPDGAIKIMDDAGVAVSIISMPDAGTHFDDAKNIARSRQMNEYLAELAQSTPARRGSLACLPLTTIDGSLAELAYALDELKMDAVTLPTSVGGVNLGDVRFDPLFEELNRRRATVFTHPVMPPQVADLTLGLNQAVLEFVFDTTRMITNMITSGATVRFPDVKVIASHGGGTLPYLITRLQTLLPVVGSGGDRPRLSAEEVLERAGYFYYDLTAATSPAHLTALAQIVPTSKLLVGFDIPYLRPSTMRPAIENVLAWDAFDDADVEKIFHTNAAELFPSVEARLVKA